MTPHFIPESSSGQTANSKQQTANSKQQTDRTAGCQTVIAHPGHREESECTQLSRRSGSNPVASTMSGRSSGARIHSSSPTRKTGWA
ncbi:MAG: hypothetical protein EX267_10825 [Acidimicrobiia bacterium]|nr:MAG: hypothetical protein EX267_10825 [Acidimicrobiia bacterium]